jgi:phosphohistidine phosphatase
MKIYLVQHGKSRDELEDPARPLTKEGARESEALADRIKGRLMVSRIFCSKKLRAQQTAKIISNKLGIGHQPVDGLKPMDDISNAMEMIEDGVMFVGHLPYLSRLASRLLSGNPELETVRFTYSGILCLEEDNGWHILFYELP